MAEIVYLLVNEAMPGLVKIGRTGDDLASRIYGLFTTGVPVPFELFYAAEVENSKFVEAQLHEAFGGQRLNKRREFFTLAPERAKAALLLAAKREVRLGQAELPTEEDKSDVEVLKRRTRFRLSMIDLKPGTELKLEKDPTIICTTVDDTNKVLFNGNQTTLSDAALQALNGLGYEWASASGPWEWTYGGKRLDEIRAEIDARTD